MFTNCSKQSPPQSTKSPPTANCTPPQQNAIQGVLEAFTTEPFTPSNERKLNWFRVGWVAALRFPCPPEDSRRTGAYSKKPWVSDSFGMNGGIMDSRRGKHKKSGGIPPPHLSLPACSSLPPVGVAILPPFSPKVKGVASKVLGKFSACTAAEKFPKSFGVPLSVLVSATLGYLVPSFPSSPRSLFTW